MPFRVFLLILTFFLDLIRVLIRSKQDQALEVLILRHQLRIALRQAPTVPRLSRWEKVTLAALGTRCRDLAGALVLVKPATVLRWHREIVRRKWTFGNTAKRGRPATPAATVELIVRLARENPTWGYGKLQGELLKVGHRASQATIKRVLRRQGLPPAPRRRRTTWRAFLARHRDQLLACDFFTVCMAWVHRHPRRFPLIVSPARAGLHSSPRD
jgi:putative transposase